MLTLRRSRASFVYFLLTFTALSPSFWRKHCSDLGQRFSAMDTHSRLGWGTGAVVLEVSVACLLGFKALSWLPATMLRGFPQASALIAVAPLPLLFDSLCDMVLWSL